MPESGALETVAGLEALRRDLRALGKAAGRELDQEAKEIANKVRDQARATTPKQSGKTARSIVTSSTYRGIAVRSGKVNFGQHEYGAQIWLRRGLPYPAGTAGPTEAAGGTIGGRTRASVPIRQVPAAAGRNGQARVVNEARYLIPRSAPIRRAANYYAPVLKDQAERMIARLQSKYRLTG